MRGCAQVLEAIDEQSPPARGRRLRAETDEAEERFSEDRLRDPEGGLDDHGPVVCGSTWTRRIRAREQPIDSAASTKSSCFVRRTSARTSRASVGQVAKPIASVKDLDARPERGDEQERDENGREREHDVGRAHQDRVGQLTVEPGDRAERHTDRDRDRLTAEADDQ